MNSTRSTEPLPYNMINLSIIYEKIFVVTCTLDLFLLTFFLLSFFRHVLLTSTKDNVPLTGTLSYKSKTKTKFSFIVFFKQSINSLVYTLFPPKSSLTSEIITDKINLPSFNSNRVWLDQSSVIFNEKVSKSSKPTTVSLLSDIKSWKPNTKLALTLFFVLLFLYVRNFLSLQLFPTFHDITDNSSYVEFNQWFFNGIFHIDLLSSLVFIFVSFLFFLFIQQAVSFMSSAYKILELTLLFFLIFFFLIGLIFCCDFLSFYLFLEGLTVTLIMFLVVGYSNSKSLESGIKYFCLSLISSTFLALGVALIFGFSGQTKFIHIKYFLSLYEHTLILSESFFLYGLFFLSLGFFFKLSLFPCHMWVPDVYEGTSYETLLLFAVIVKLVIFLLFLKIFFNVFFFCLYLYKTYMILICCCSMLVGCLGALAQTKLKRFLAFSSMNQLSLFILTTITGNVTSISNGVAAMFIYSITLFAVIAMFNQMNGVQNTTLVYFKDLSYIKLYNKKQAYVIVFLLSSLAGLPPFIGFFAKFFIILDFIQNGYFILSFYILFINLISVYYYLKVIKCLFFEKNMQTINSTVIRTQHNSFWNHNIYFKQIEDFGLFVFFSTLLILFLLKYLSSFYLFIQYLVLDQFVLETCLHYNNF